MTQLPMTALWPRPAPIPEPPATIRTEWKRRGRASTPAARAEVLALLEEGWSIGAVPDATGGRPAMSRCGDAERAPRPLRAPPWATIHVAGALLRLPRAARRGRRTRAEGSAMPDSGQLAGSGRRVSNARICSWRNAALRLLGTVRFAPVRLILAALPCRSTWLVATWGAFRFALCSPKLPDLQFAQALRRHLQNFSPELVHCIRRRTHPRKLH
jgi:hypothetical protein